MSSINPAPRETTARTHVLTPLFGAIAFLGFYLAVDPVSGLVSSAALPLPGAPTAEVVAYLRANPAAMLVTALLQLLSIVGLAVVVGSASTRVEGTATDATTRRIAKTFGWLAVAVMTVSAATAIVIAATAATAMPDALVTLRTISFLSGGVVHVVALGIFVFALGRLHGWTKPVRVTAWVAAVPAVLSIASLFWFYASILLPVGRVLCMIALIVAGVSLARGRTPVATMDAMP